MEPQLHSIPPEGFVVSSAFATFLVFDIHDGCAFSSLTQQLTTKSRQASLSISRMSLGNAVFTPAELPQVIEFHSFGMTVDKANINGTRNIYS